MTKCCGCDNVKSWHRLLTKRNWRAAPSLERAEPCHQSGCLQNRADIFEARPLCDIVEGENSVRDVFRDFLLVHTLQGADIILGQGRSGRSTQSGGVRSAGLSIALIIRSHLTWLCHVFLMPLAPQRYVVFVQPIIVETY